MKRINIFVGNYGCGKTELSINAALKLKAAHDDVILADMDIVNPYFRSSEQLPMLEEKGIRVIMPQFARTQVDVPSLPAELFAAFETPGYSVIDCGGDPAGATALGSYSAQIARLGDEVEIYFVVNARRPFLQNAADAVDMLNIIEHVARLKATALINNTNLSFESSVNDIIYGYEVCLETERLTGVPLGYNSGLPELLAQFEREVPGHRGELFELKPYMRPYWLQA